jgi:flagellar motor switch/type III secretory pathway protein FliN
MDAQPLLWVSDASLDRLREALSGRLASWAQAWGLPTPGVPLVRPWSGSDAEGSKVDSNTNPSDLTLATSLPAAWADGLSQAFFGGKGLRSAIVTSVLQDCHDQLRAALLPPDAAATGTQAKCPGHVGAQLEVVLLGHTWVVVWPIAALLAGEHLVRPKAASVPRWASEPALAPCSVSLQAIVGTAEVDVLGVMNLAPGDVIVLRQRLDDPVAVHGVNTPLRLHAHLGAQADRIALQWLPTPTAA